MNICRLVLFAVMAVGLVHSAHADVEIERGAKIEGRELVQVHRLSIAPSRAAFHVSQPVRLRIVLENRGETPLHILVASPLEVYQFDVRKPTGETAALTTTGRRKIESISTHLQIVSPGDSVSDPISDLSELFDMTTIGEYTITVHRNVLTSKNDHAWIRLTSNTIEVRIHDDNKVKRDEVAPGHLEGNDIPRKVDDSHIKLDAQGRIIEF
jgi:hypothetical protein